MRNKYCRLVGANNSEPLTSAFFPQLIPRGLLTKENFSSIYRLFCGSVLFLSMSFLGGCAGMVSRMTPDSAAQRASAEPLVVSEANEADKNDKKNYLGKLLQQSQDKCQKFVNNLVTNMQEINATGDILSTFFSAVGAAVTPISTAHALSAASAITSGSKNALNADIYDNATIANISTALQQTYSSTLIKYRSDLEEADDSKLVLQIEVSKIKDIHALCGIASAEATITATLKQAIANSSANTGEQKPAVQKNGEKGTKTPEASPETKGASPSVRTWGAPL